jgi:mannan endo-1,4-beta-mannosidase
MKKFLFIFIFCIIFSQFLFSQLKTGQLRVEGKYLKDGAGNTVRLIGINHGHAWYRGYLDSALQGIRSWGANSVRVVLTNGYRWTKIPASEVSTIIRQAKSYGFKAIVLEVHDTTGYGDQGAQGACTLDQAVDYWIEIKSVLDGQEDFVIINIGNEPVGNNRSYVSQWANWTKSAIQRLRNNGFTHVIMVDAPNWGQDWTNTMRYNASDVLNADSLRNTIFSVHMYGVYDTASEVQSYISYFYNNNLPLCIGEFGHYHTDGDPNEQAIVQYAKQYGYSIFGWSWCGNGDGVEYLDMVYNWNANSPTNWGSWYKTNALSDVQTYYTLTVNVSPQGSGSVSLNPPGGSYTAGTQVTLTAQANSGYVFSSWSGDLSGTTNPATITINSNKTVTANFVQSGGGSTTYTLSVSVSPTSAGVVYLNPSGGVYTAGTQVTLTAQANSGYVFSSWSGDLSGTTNPATITMNSNKTVTANFVQSNGGGSTTYTLSVSVSPTSAGVVYLNPSGGVYTAGTQVTLTAQANSGYVFSSWSGDLSGTTNPATITMNSNKTVTANFVQQSVSGYTLSVSVSPSGSGVVSINPFKSKYTAGEQVTLTAQANSGYVFSSWSGDLSGTTNPATIQ